MRMLVYMRTNHRSKPKPPAEALPADAAARPSWLPIGDRWNDLPEAVRQAVPRVILPAYRQFVLDAPDELQRSIGLSLVHLLWLEVCDQSRVTEVVADRSCLAAVPSLPALPPPSGQAQVTVSSGTLSPADQR